MICVLAFLSDVPTLYDVATQTMPAARPGYTTAAEDAMLDVPEKHSTIKDDNTTYSFHVPTSL